MMRKRNGGGNGNGGGGGGGGNSHSRNGGNGNNSNSSHAVSKLLMQNQSSSSNNNHYRDGQTILLDVRESIVMNGGTTTTTTSSRSNNGTSSSSSTTSSNNHGRNGSDRNGNGGDNHNHNHDSQTQLNIKNHRLAKELSEVRVRHREECKNVTRLTMENMNLASRCREAITQAANMKKDLSIQKRKTAEAVAQTHLLLDQLKKMKQQQQQTQTIQQEAQQTRSKEKDTSKVKMSPPVVPPPSNASSSSSSNTDPVSKESVTGTDANTNIIASSTNDIMISTVSTENVIDPTSAAMMIVEEKGVSSPVLRPLPETIPSPTKKTTTTTVTTLSPTTIVNGLSDDIAVTTGCNIVNDVTLPMDHVPNPDDDDIIPVVATEQGNQDINIVLSSSSLPSSSPTNTIQKSFVVTTPTSCIQSSVVDLDISYDDSTNDREVCDTQEHEKWNSNNIVNIIHVQEKSDVGALSIDHLTAPITPLDTATMIVEYDNTFDDDVVVDDDGIDVDVPNGNDDLQQLKVTTLARINTTDHHDPSTTNGSTIIQPTNLEDHYFQNKSSSSSSSSTSVTTTQMPHNAIDVNEVLQNDDTIHDMDMDITIPNDKSLPSLKGSVVTSIMTKFMSEGEEEELYDDSEHKCDDSYMEDRGIILELPLTNVATLTTTDPKQLVSSDDYEIAMGIDDDNNHHHGEDVIIKDSDDRDTEDDGKFAEKLDNIQPSNIEPVNVVVGTKTLFPQESSNPLISTSSAIAIDGTDTQLGHIDDNNFPTPVDDIIDITIPKSKDLWIEDYDEAAAAQGLDDDDDDETSDTLSGLLNVSCGNVNDSLETDTYFPHSASPKISTTSDSIQMLDSNSIEVAKLPTTTAAKRYKLPPPSLLLNEGYEEEFPSDIVDRRRYPSSSTRFSKEKAGYEAPIDSLMEETNDFDLSPTELSSPSHMFFGPQHSRGPRSSLISSIDAFEASFQTSFPESFTPKDSPETSPISGAKVETSGVKNTSTNELTPTKSTLLNSPNGLENTTLNVANASSTEEVTPLRDKGSNIRRHGNHESDEASLQRYDSDIFIGEGAPTSTPVSSPTYESKSMKSTVADQSAKWLIEVKASTEKHKCSIDTNIEKISTDLGTVHLQTDNGAIRSAYSNNGAALDHSTNAKASTVKSSTTQSQESPCPAPSSEPVFRQFPRTATPAKSFKHISSRLSRTSYADDRLTASITDKTPLLQERVNAGNAIRRSAPPQQIMNGESDMSVRSRYTGVLGQTSSATTAERGRLPISRRKVANANSLEASATMTLPQSAAEIKDTTDREMAKSLNLTVNVRERAAIYAKVSSPVSPNNGHNLPIKSSDATPYSVRPNAFGASRSTVRILEDEGDIPMQTSLSPRKCRNDDFTNLSITGQINRGGIGERDIARAHNAIESIAKNYQRSTESSNSKVLDHDKQITPVDVGRQRRHINLSGRGRLSRKNDHENDSTHVNDYGY